MKKGVLRLTSCCLGLLLAANVSCAVSKNELIRVEKVGTTPESAGIFKVRKLSESEEAAATKDQPYRQVMAKDQPGEVRRVPTGNNVYPHMPDSEKTVGTEIILAEMTKEVAGKVFYALQGEDKNLAARIAVVNGVPISDFKRDTEFGRVVGEYLLTELVDRGLRVTELRLGKDIMILPQTGEFILSRNIGELANKNPEPEYVVVTTFANTSKTLIVQGRLVRIGDGAVKISWRYSLPLNRELRALFQSPEMPYKIAVKGVGR